MKPFLQILNTFWKYVQQHYWVGFSIVAVVGTGLALFNLGGQPIQPWDEARYGSIALEMLQRGDWINYYFAGTRDTVVSKPPLAIWSIALSYTVFGFNEWALRLPSALAIIASFGVLFKIVTLYRKPGWALLTCLMLMGVRAWIGHHVGRTGDTDALLTLCLMGSAYYYLKAVDFQCHRCWWGVGLLLGAAFMTKGTAVGTIVPGLLLYAVYRKKVKELLRQPAVWGSIGLFVVTALSWYGMVHLWGVPYPEQQASTSNPLYRLLWHDTWERFTQSKPGFDTSPFFVFNYLDIRMDIWCYLFYLLGGIFLVEWVRKRLGLGNCSPSLQWFAFLSWTSWGLLMTFSPVQHQWYMAPVAGLIAINMMGLVHRYKGYTHWLKIGVVVLVLFTLSRKGYRQYDTKSYPPLLKDHTEQFRSADPLICFHKPRHHYLLYLQFQQPELQVLYASGKVSQAAGERPIIFTRTKLWKKWQARWTDFQPVDQNETFIILKK
jgi:4-amino-4-deoxy-L-arabinose transferase-like glycosyltransferase